MVKKVLRASLGVLLASFCIVAVTGCSQVKELITPPDPIRKEAERQITIEDYEDAFATGVATYAAENPMDVLYPEGEEQPYLCPEYVTDSRVPAQYRRFVIPSEDVIFSPVLKDEDKGRVYITIVNYSEEKAAWMREHICNADVFTRDEFVFLSEKNEYYNRELPSEIKNFLGAMRAYAKKHAGAPDCTYSEFSVYTGQAGMERRVRFALSEDAEGFRVVFPETVSDAAKAWITDEFFGGELPEWVQITGGAEVKALADWDVSDLRKSSVQIVEEVETQEPETQEQREDGEDEEGETTTEQKKAWELIVTAPKEAVSTKDHSVLWEVRNRENRPMFFDTTPTLEVKIEDTWYQVPWVYGKNAAPTEGNAYGRAIPDNERASFALDLDAYAELMPAEYRVIQKVDIAPGAYLSEKFVWFGFEVK